VKDDFKSRDFIRDMERAARDLRAKARGFSGLEASFASIQQKMLLDFKDAGLISHPGDKGTAREDLLRSFLADKGYLPSRFGVSPGSSHVVSSDGRISAQMDLVLYDALNAPRLMTMGAIQYFPVECVYGVVEVKSDLNSKDRIRDGLDKVASFRSLQAMGEPTGAHLVTTPMTRGFGVLFAYDATLKWRHVHDTVQEWQRERPSTQWPNMVVVLNQGMLLQSDKTRVLLHSDEIERVETSTLHFVPADDMALLHLYLLLLDLLTALRLPRLSVRQYASLPARMDDHSVRFSWGSFSEVGTCRSHGTFLRQLSRGSAEKILSACKDQKPRDPLAALDEAYGKEAPHPAAPSSHLVNIYNPEGHTLSDILLKDATLVHDGQRISAPSLAYEELSIDGAVYWVPQYYQVKQNLITGCPDCDTDPHIQEQLSVLTIDNWREILRKHS
jgi:hypothetical protein